MKLINFNFLITVLFLYEFYVSSKPVNTLENKDLTSNFLNDMKHLNLNITEFIKILSSNWHEVKKINPNNKTVEDDFYNSVDNSLVSIKEFHELIDQKIKMYEDKISRKTIVKHKNLKRKKSLDEDTLNFYNSLSLIMLALLAGGLVGIVFILYFSFRNDEKANDIIT